MVYITSWHRFQQAATDLYTRSPNDVRYCVKWRSSEGKLVLKITDNATCLKFKTSSSVFLNRFEALNLSLVEKMQNRQVKVETPEAPALIPPPQISVVATASGSVLTPQSTAAASGGVKKKKSKKKR